MKKAMVLGGTLPHKELIRILKSEEYYVILADYLENPPAKDSADLFVRESTLDYEKMLEVAKSNEVDVVIATCIDQANSAMCFVAEKLNLPLPYSFDTSILVTDKSKMKTVMKDNGIPTSNFVIVDENKKYSIDDLKYPLVVKPVDCNGSKGVRKVMDLTNIDKFLTDAINMSRTNTAIIEEFKEGTEIQFDCFVKNGKSSVVMIKQRNKMDNCGADVLQSYGSTIPAKLSEKTIKQIDEIANKIPKAFDFDNTPFFAQAIVDKNDDVYVIEFAPRIGGGMSYRMIKEITGFDVLYTTFKAYTNQSFDVDFHKPNGVYKTCLLYSKKGIFDHVEGYKRFVENGSVIDFTVLKTKGTELEGTMASNNRICSMIIHANSYEEVDNIEKEIIENIKVIDIYGNNILNYEKY